MFGAEGIDFMLGVFDDDNMDGGDGNDDVLGGAGNDRMNGGDGPDILNSLSFWYVYTCIEVITAKKVVFSH